MLERFLDWSDRNGDTLVLTACLIVAAGVALGLFAGWLQ